MGTAERHPSAVVPWQGTTIIQAKHTNGYNRSFSEADFFSTSATKTVLGKEVPRIVSLRANGQLDNYMLFANRRLAGNAESAIRAHLAEACDLPEESIYLCGIERLETLLKSFPEIPKRANLDPIDSPLIVSPDDLSDVVQALVGQRKDLAPPPDDPPTSRLTYERKNALNNMSVAYARAQRKRYLIETAQIRTFLAAPENLDLLRMYESVADEFQLKIISRRKNYQEFDAVMEYLADLLFKRDPILRCHKRLTRAMLFYMYWNCDIGEAGDA